MLGHIMMKLKESRKEENTCMGAGYGWKAGVIMMMLPEISGI